MNSWISVAGFGADKFGAGNCLLVGIFTKTRKLNVFNIPRLPDPGFIF